MKKIISLLFLISLSAYAQSYSPGLPLPGLPKSLGPKTMANSTSVTLATDQNPITVTFSSTGAPLTVSVVGKTPFSTLRRDYSVNNVLSTTYSTLVASLSQNVNALEVFDSSGQTLSFATGGAGSESKLILDYPGGNGLIPIFIASGTRLSITATTGTVNSGELDLNFYH